MPGGFGIVTDGQTLKPDAQTYAKMPPQDMIKLPDRAMPGHGVTLERSHDMNVFSKPFSVAALALSGLAAMPACADTMTYTALKVAKECSKFTAHVGDFCTITESDLAAIPVGAKVFYFGPVLGPVILSTDVVLDAGDGNLALGYCNVELAKAAGTCTFRAGSGTLAGFQSIVTLTIDGTGLFHWDGGYVMAQ